MIGRVDEEGRALVTIRMGAAKNALVHEVDAWVELNVVAKDGSNPLLGVGLLIGRDLRVSYRGMTVSIE